MAYSYACKDCGGMGAWPVQDLVTAHCVLRKAETAGKGQDACI